jgi:hypothetical protein
LKKKESQPHLDRMKHLIGVEIPEGEFEILKEEDKEEVNSRCEASKAEIKELIDTFRSKGYLPWGLVSGKSIRSFVYSHRDLAQNRCYSSEDDISFGTSIQRNRPPSQTHRMGLVRQGCYELV